MEAGFSQIQSHIAVRITLLIVTCKSGGSLPLRACLYKRHILFCKCPSSCPLVLEGSQIMKNIWKVDISYTDKFLDVYVLKWRLPVTLVPFIKTYSLSVANENSPWLRTTTEVYMIVVVSNWLLHHWCNGPHQRWPTQRHGWHLSQCRAWTCSVNEYTSQMWYCRTNRQGTNKTLNV